MPHTETDDDSKQAMRRRCFVHDHGSTVSQTHCDLNNPGDYTRQGLECNRQNREKSALSKVFCGRDTCDKRSPDAAGCGKRDGDAYSGT